MIEKETQGRPWFQRSDRHDGAEAEEGRERVERRRWDEAK
jgi:hypothetical protein